MNGIYSFDLDKGAEQITSNNDPSEFRVTPETSQVYTINKKNNFTRAQSNTSAVLVATYTAVQQTFP
jgi:hypothetical protein